MSRTSRWVVSLLMLSVIGCDPFDTSFDALEDAVMYEARTIVDPPQSPAPIRVLTWNMKFGGARVEFFFDCFGDRVLMGHDEVRANMDGIVAAIRTIDPDIVMLQEVDVKSKRSAYIDQVQLLLDETDMNYGAYASAWKADYIPSDGLGRMDAGNAVLSRWPIASATRIALEPIADHDALTRYFYLKRNLLRVHVPVPGADNLQILNAHTAAFAQDGTKQRHVDRFVRELDEMDADGALIVGGGDLNIIPRGSTTTSDFPDAVCPDDVLFAPDDYSDQLDTLDALYATYVPAISLNDFQASNDEHYTFTADKDAFWNRKLDYLFTNGTFTGSITHQDSTSGGVTTMPLSDHAPISATLELP